MKAETHIFDHIEMTPLMNSLAIPAKKPRGNPFGVYFGFSLESS